MKELAVASEAKVEAAEKARVKADSTSRLQEKEATGAPQPRQSAEWWRRRRQQEKEKA